MSTYQSKKNLIGKIYELLDSPNCSLASILRHSIRLANSTDKDFYRVLFEHHLYGLEKNQNRLGRKSKDVGNIAVAKRFENALFFDRGLSKNRTATESMEALEHNIQTLEESIKFSISNKFYEDVSNFYSAKTDIKSVFIKIRNRINSFLSEVELDLAEEYGSAIRIKENMANYSKKEYSVLKTLYDLSERQAERWILLNDLEKALELPQEEIYAIITDLENRKHLIGSIEEAVWILPAGIEQIEKTKNYPEKATDYYPANIFNTFNAPVTGIQQGGQNNTQNITQNINSDFDKIVSPLIDLIRSSQMSSDEREEHISDIQSLQKLAAKEPTAQNIEKAKLRISLLDTALKGTDIALKAAPYFPHLIAFFEGLVK